MSLDVQLKELLVLEPIEPETITFGEYLSRLKENPWLADTAAALLVRAVEAKGEVKLSETAPERVPYLQMLKKRGISSYAAFDKVKGSQRTVARIINRLRAAASGGYQLRQAIVLKGGPGSGKSFLAEALAAVLEGMVIYSVDGCPVHENPLNLLKLLTEKQRNDIAHSLGMCGDANQGKAHDCQHEHKHDSEKHTPTLGDLLNTAGEPCPHCWSLVFEGANKDKPNLFDVKIKAMRMSSRKFGITTWSGDDQLIEALKRGSRGVVRMPELFSVDSKIPLMGGSNAGQLKDLLDATNDRRISAQGGKIQIPGLASIPTTGNACSDETGWFPFDGILVGETNDEGFEMFIKNTPDAQKFTRRLHTMNVPYILSVTEEELAYREFIQQMREQPHFDPMALKLAALLAVISRLKKDHEVDLVTRARMYDGEELVVQRKSSPVAASPSSSSYSGVSSSYGGARPVGQEAQYWTVDQYWAEAGEDEGMYGLNIADMLAAVSQSVDMALKGTDHKCVSSPFIMMFMRAYVANMLKTPGLSNKQKDVLKNCEEFLKAPRSRSDTPALIEAEYRRVLKRQFLDVADPNAEARKTELFNKYRIHAGAFARSDKKAVEQHTTPDGRTIKREVDIDLSLLSDLETWMRFETFTDKENFRRSIESEIADEILKRNQSRPDGDDSEAEPIGWRTLPKLAMGITRKLNDETAKVLERLLQPEFKLSEDDKKLRAEALARFDKLGYCEHCRDVALQYCKDYELWKQS